LIRSFLTKLAIFYWLDWISWSKIAQYLPGRTDNEIKNYWRTRVQKHAKQLKCDVNSKQFKDTMRYLWMPRLVERIQAAATAPVTTTVTAAATNNAFTYGNNLNNNKFEVLNHKGRMGLTDPSVANNDFVGSHVTQSYTTPENSSTGASSSDSFGTQVSTISDLTEYYSVPENTNSADYYQPSQISNYSDNCITSPSGFLFPQGLDLQSMDPNTPWNMQSGDSSDNFWDVESMLFLEQQLMNDNMWNIGNRKIRLRYGSSNIF